MIADNSRAAPPVIVIVEPLLVGSAVAAAMLGMSQRTLQRLASAGEVPRPLVLGGKRLWAVSELKAWASAGAPTVTVWEARSARHTEGLPDGLSRNSTGRLSMKPAGLRHQ